MTPTAQELDSEVRYRLNEMERMAKEGRALAVGLLHIARRMQRLADRALDLVADLAATDAARYPDDEGGR